MTKEELEKEAVRYCTSNCGDCYGCHKKYRKNKNCERLKSMIKTYLTSAEPREKQIEIDAKQIRALQKQNGELTDKVKELEAQIGKMKSCRICVSYDDLAISDWSPCKTCKNKSNWELSD